MVRSFYGNLADRLREKDAVDTDQFELPVFEVIVREKGSDQAVVVFFRNDDNSLTAMVGVTTSEDVSFLCEVLRAAEYACHNASDWVTLDERPLQPAPF